MVTVQEEQAMSRGLGNDNMAARVSAAEEPTQPERATVKNYVVPVIVLAGLAFGMVGGNFFSSPNTAENEQTEQVGSFSEDPYEPVSGPQVDLYAMLPDERDFDTLDYSWMPAGYMPTGTFCPTEGIARVQPNDKVWVSYALPDGTTAAVLIADYRTGDANAVLKAAAQGATDCRQFNDELGSGTVQAKESPDAITLNINLNDDLGAIEVYANYTRHGNVIVTTLVGGTAPLPPGLGESVQRIANAKA